MGEASEQGLLFLGGRGAGNGIAGTGARRAKEAGLAAFEAQGANALSAEGFIAVGASDDGLDAGMVQAGERPVEKMGLNGW